MDSLLSTKDLVRIFGVTKRTIEGWIVRKKIPEPFKVSGKLFWNESEIQKFIESKKN